MADKPPPPLTGQAPGRFSLPLILEIAEAARRRKPASSQRFRFRPFPISSPRHIHTIDRMFWSYATKCSRIGQVQRNSYAIDTACSWRFGRSRGACAGRLEGFAMSENADLQLKRGIRRRRRAAHRKSRRLVAGGISRRGRLPSHARSTSSRRRWSSRARQTAPQPAAWSPARHDNSAPRLSRPAESAPPRLGASRACPCPSPWRWWPASRAAGPVAARHYRLRAGWGGTRTESAYSAADESAGLTAIVRARHRWAQTGAAGRLRHLPSPYWRWWRRRRRPRPGRARQQRGGASAAAARGAAAPRPTPAGLWRNLAARWRWARGHFFFFFGESRQTNAHARRETKKQQGSP